MTAPAAEIPGQELLESDGRAAVLVFEAAWCSACKEAVPAVEKEIAAQGNKFKLVKIDIDRYAALADAFSIKSIPTMVGFHGGEASYGAVGRLPPKYIKKFLFEVEGFQKTIEAEAKKAKAPIVLMKPLKFRVRQMDAPQNDAGAVPQKKKRFAWLR